MTLNEWITKRADKCKSTRTHVYKELAEATYKARAPISEHTIASVDRGAKLSMYRRALALSDATGNQVTVKELCE